MYMQLELIFLWMEAAFLFEIKRDNLPERKDGWVMRNII